MPEPTDTAFSRAPQSSLANEVQNNIDILVTGSGALQQRKLTDQTAKATGTDATAFRAREEQLFRAAQRLVKLAGDPDTEANRFKADDLKRLSGLNLPDSVRRELKPVLARIQPKLAQAEPFDPKTHREAVAKRALE